MKVDSNSRRKAQIAELRTQLEKRQQQVEELVAANQRLQRRQRLLHELCGVLRHLQQHVAGNDEELQQAWSEQEQELLQQLAITEAAAPAAFFSSATPATAAPTAGGAGPDAPIAPAHDPLLLMRHSLCAVPVNITAAEEVVANYASAMRELALALHMCDATAAATAVAGQQQQQQQVWLAKLQAVMLRHFQLLGALAQQQRSDLLSVIAVTNAETGEVSAQLDVGLHQQAVQQAHISEAQAAAIAAGMEVLAPLHARVLAELQAEASSDGMLVTQQQQQPKQQQQHGVKQEQGIQDGQGQAPLQGLPAHQRRLDRIAVCMRKDVLLRASMCSFVFGVLTWRQVARILLHTYPHATHILTIGKLIWEQAVATS